MILIPKRRDYPSKEFLPSEFLYEVARHSTSVKMYAEGFLPKEPVTAVSMVGLNDTKPQAFHAVKADRKVAVVYGVRKENIDCINTHSYAVFLGSSIAKEAETLGLKIPYKAVPVPALKWQMNIIKHDSVAMCERYETIEELKTAFAYLNEHVKASLSWTALDPFNAVSDRKSRIDMLNTAKKPTPTQTVLFDEDPISPLVSYSKIVSCKEALVQSRIPDGIEIPLIACATRGVDMKTWICDSRIKPDIESISMERYSMSDFTNTLLEVA
jgi:hypothetical protein